MKGHKLATLTEPLQERLLSSYQLKNKTAYRRSKNEAQALGGAGGGLFASLEPAPTVDAQVKASSLVWATDNYVELGQKPNQAISAEYFHLIIPRVEKAAAEQKRRTKEKAEVFTPSWVCNLQNNLIDDEVLYPGAFNSATATEKTWSPTLEPVRFETDTDWVKYVADRRLEMCTGEGPYLMSRYDTTNGAFLPVRNEEGAFQRIGILDRKLRIVSENATAKTWTPAALVALNATYGYEWQGDNLLLARLNFLNTFVDYFVDFFGSTPSEELLLEVAEIASWQLWQMDGLKMVTPGSCTAKCEACCKKARTGHNGQVPVLRWGKTLKTFEDFLL